MNQEKKEHLYNPIKIHANLAKMHLLKWYSCILQGAEQLFTPEWCLFQCCWWCQCIFFCFFKIVRPLETGKLIYWLILLYKIVICELLFIINTLKFLDFWFSICYYILNICITQTQRERERLTEHMDTISPQPCFFCFVLLDLHISR